jgi:transcriptional regulator with XRE-family HTH domain
MFGMDIRATRLARGWSQEDLAARTGLSSRTIQRLENGARPSAASARLLAAAFEVEVADVLAPGATTSTGDRMPPRPPAPIVEAVRDGALGFSDFEGRAGRPDYWWFLLAVLVVTAAATALSEALGAAVSVVLSLPLAAVGARRLHDTGRSGWWQLLALAPFGFVVVLTLMAQPTDDAASLARRTPSFDAASADADADATAADPAAG